MKFQIGDRVICTHPAGDHLKMGLSYMVSDFRIDANGQVYIAVKAISKTNRWQPEISDHGRRYSESRFRAEVLDLDTLGKW